MWQSGAYSSYYQLIKPNHSDPYHDYLDASHQYPDEIIDYDYHRDFKGWNTIEEYKILPDDIDTSIDKESPNKSRKFKFDSEIYGYFSPYLNDPNPKPYDFIGSRLNDGKHGRDNNIYWQSQGDQTDLEIKTLKKINKKIIGPTKENYEEYLRIKNLKEKWNVYRHTICCDKQDIKMQFFAVIEDAILISNDGGIPNRGGIYEYSWREVEIWPTDAINDICQEVDASGNLIEPEILTSEDAKISVVVVPGGLEGKHFTDTGGELTDDPDGGEGDWTNGAYNINELLNIKEGDDVYVGPGVNVADEDFNDYPEAFQMMPVGGYFKIGDDPCADDHEETIHFHKHIVQMYRLPSYMLDCIVPSESEPEEGATEGEGAAEGEPEGEPENLGPEEIFFFDVPNAHDGLCSCID